MFNFKDYAFRVKCNNTPSMIIKVVAEDYDKAISYAKACMPQTIQFMPMIAIIFGKLNHYKQNNYVGTLSCAKSRKRIYYENTIYTRQQNLHH